LESHVITKRFCENTFWKMTPQKQKNMGNWKTLNFRENGFNGLPPNLQPLREVHA
jgi:hypothetical protein